MSRKWTSLVAALLVSLISTNVVFGQVAEGVDPFGSETPDNPSVPAKEKPRGGGGGLRGMRGAAARAAADQPVPGGGGLGEPNKTPEVDFARILKQPIDFEFADTPLADVAEYCGKKLGINVRLDRKGLTDAAVDESAPVTFSTVKPVSFESALRMILDEFDLTFVVVNEALTITSKEKADEIMVTKVYFVGDLMRTGPQKSPQFGALMNLITSVIQPDSWDDNGGPGCTHPFGRDFVVVSQKQDVHDEVVTLFEKLREQLKTRGTSLNAGKDEISARLYSVGTASGMQMADAIKALVAPSTWKDQGGQGEIRVVERRAPTQGQQPNSATAGDSLLIRQTGEVHDQITEILAGSNPTNLIPINGPMGGTGGAVSGGMMGGGGGMGGGTGAGMGGGMGGGMMGGGTFGGAAGGGRRRAAQPANLQQSQTQGRPPQNELSLVIPRRPGDVDNHNVPAVGANGGEAYASIVENVFESVWQQPLSTFSIDVDTASYANVRRFLNQNSRPPAEAVRIEEMVNYFHYDYAPPQDNVPFAAHTAVADCPWAPTHRLVRVALKGREIAVDHRPATNLVFLLDVSGSMNDPNKLPLVKEGMRLLVGKLDENDRVAIVVYAGASGLVLPSTRGNDKQTILQAIDALQPGGSTNGASGIQLAYETAVANFVRGGANRVILATDGDFNVGITDADQLVALIKEKAASGIFLSVLGFGMGNLKDATLEQLADKGNGNYAYIDSLAEARKVLVEQLSGTLVTIAKDVKIQIEFNPARVQSYRLIGYENRILAKEDFNDDKKDAGEIGAGHTVTALYEVIPAGAPSAVDKLEYQSPQLNPAAEQSNDLLTLKLRYKEPEGDESKLLKFRVADRSQPIAAAGDDFEFAAAVAAFGMILRQSAHKGSANIDLVLQLAEAGQGADRDGYRLEFTDLVRKARAISP
ncbi:MAG TPA: VWA domain-containing protein [Pirellulales bacterium]|jgi:Ca-activated chloride channel family protein